MKRLTTQHPKTERPKTERPKSLRTQRRCEGMRTEFCAQRGAAGVEYGIMVAAIAATIVAVAILLGPMLLPGFQAVINALP